MSLQTISSLGGGPLTNLLASGAGPRGILGLVTVAAVVLVPATQIKTTYGISVGYGAAMAAMGVALGLAYPAPQSWLAPAVTAATVVYGVRLSVFLWLRQVLEWRPPTPSHALNETPRLKRIPFALSLALFYACLATPLLFVVANEESSLPAMRPLQILGLALAWGGVWMEGIADAHKSWVKLTARKTTTDSSVFVGPTGGLYALVRHPNYLGEVTFYTGLTVAAIPALGKSLPGWICSLLGLAGITSLMSGSTRRLVEKQEKTYGGQAKFEAWKKKVPYPWIPLVKDVNKTK